ncbi:hypothetical protein [Novipirellula artificiosorum]|nr:hypothetical protein [Novipirellula artificiosorum]
MMLVVCACAKNWIATELAQFVAKTVTGCEVNIESIQLGFASIVVDSIDVREPADTTLRQITLKRAEIDLSLWNGFRHGKWASRVLVSEPTLHLRFDCDGKLVSQFPKSEGESETSVSVPFHLLMVNDARVVVHQTDRRPFHIRGRFSGVRTMPALMSAS